MWVVKQQGRRHMAIPDFAGIVPILRSKRATGEAAVIATIVRNVSPLAVRPSARMVVARDGIVTGSIPGTLGERLRTDGLACLAENRSRLLSYQAEDDNIIPTGIQHGNIDVYFEVLAATPRLIVVGAGHIAVPLVQVAKLLGYDVVVLDDRAVYATAERFPAADMVLHGPYRETLATLAVDANTYIVLVTRGHVHDSQCLELVIDSPAPYIGMIGSKKRVRTVIDHLRGPAHRNLDRVYAPIGIDIGAHTPEEIAVAIGAELVNVRRGGKAASLRLRAGTGV